MQTFEKKSEMPVSAEELYDWHMSPRAFDRLVPPWQKLRVLERPDNLGEGARLVMRVYAGPVGVKWVALHRDFVVGQQFVDEQLQGPFADWVHTHRFEQLDDHRSLLHDHIEYRLPLGPLGRVFGALPTKLMLERMFDYRHRVTRESLLKGSSSSGARRGSFR